MRNILCILLAAALLILSTACLAEVTGPAYLGTWVCGRATIVITDEHPGYRIEITWGNSAAEVTEWNYYCPYTLTDRKLVSEPTGVKTDVTYGADGEVAQSVTGYEDGQATFSIGEDDRLAWADAKENAGADMAFERAEIVGFAPTAEEFAFSYFNMIGDGELSMDKKACEALNFAAASELWHADRAAMRDNMFMAWEGLSETEQSAFDDSFMDVVHLLDACYADWAANRATFTDGRDERMDELLAEPLYQEAWQTLLGNTLTLGNSED